MTIWRAPRNCKYCGTTFTPEQKKKGTHTGRHFSYCSNLCAANAQARNVEAANERYRQKRIKNNGGIEDKRHFTKYKIRALDYKKTYPTGHVENLHALMTSYAKLHGYKLNPDEHRVDMVLRGLLGRNVRYGLYYCPSRTLIQDPTFDSTIVCPCCFIEDDVQYRGQCYCKLFVREDFEEWMETHV